MKLRLTNPALLRGLLLETGLTMKELEEPLGLSQPHLSNVLAGRRNLSRAKAEQICRTLGVDITRLFADDIADATADTLTVTA